MWSHFFLAVATFVATNVDDLLILTFYFGSRRYRPGEVVTGQYLGIIILIAISLSGLLVRKVIDGDYLNLLGIFPILLGIKELLDRNRYEEDESPSVKAPSGNGVTAVAMVTLANGGDNIGVYTPLFVNTESILLPFYCAVFLVLTGVFCVVGYYFVNHPLTKDLVTRYGSLFMPYFLILLGALILLDLF